MRALSIVLFAVVILTIHAASTGKGGKGETSGGKGTSGKPSKPGKPGKPGKKPGFCVEEDMMTRLCTAGSDMEDLQDTIESCQDYGLESRSMLEDEEEELEEVRAIEIEVQEFAAEVRAKKPGKGGKGGNKPSSTSGGKPSKPGKGGNKPSKPGKGNNKPKCPEFQELVTGLKMKYADDYCVFNTYGMMEFHETTGNMTIDEEGIRNALGTLPEEIVAKFEGEEADTCMAKVSASVIDKLGKCFDKYSAEEQAAITQFATAAVYYECFKVMFEQAAITQFATT